MDVEIEIVIGTFTNILGAYTCAMRIQWKNKSLDLFRSRVYMCCVRILFQKNKSQPPLLKIANEKKVSTFKLLTIRRREGERERKK